MLEYWQLLDWLAQYSSECGLKFNRRPWFLRPPHFPDQTVYCDVMFEGRVYFGLGHSTNARLAHAIAAAEALERVGMASLKLHNSNGCAVHMDETRAQRGALSELVERDAFLCHYYTGTALAPLPASLSARLSEMKALASTHGWSLEAGVMSNALGLPSILVAMKGSGREPRRGMFTGLGLSEDWNVALEKALGECWRFADSDMADSSALKSLTVEEFKALKEKGVKEHIRLSADPDFGEAVWKRFFPHGETVNATEVGLLERTTFQTFALKTIFKDCPLIFAHAKNDGLAPVGFGGRWKESLNHPRYLHFSSRGADIDWPHSMG